MVEAVQRNSVDKILGSSGSGVFVFDYSNDTESTSSNTSSDEGNTQNPETSGNTKPPDVTASSSDTDSAGNTQKIPTDDTELSLASFLTASFCVIGSVILLLH